MSSVLALQPHRPDTPAALLRRAGALLDALAAASPYPVRIVREAVVGQGAGRYGPHADARNQMLHHLGDEDYVLWADADLIHYPPTLLRELLGRNPGGISAPVVVLDKTGQFYDVGGFVDLAGQCARPAPPWFDQPGPAYALASVGCLYVAPAHIYREWGLRYAPTGPRYGVEHYAVCGEAARRGVPVRAYADLVAVHAWLPDYGLPHS